MLVDSFCKLMLKKVSVHPSLTLLSSCGGCSLMFSPLPDTCDSSSLVWASLGGRDTWGSVLPLQLHPSLCRWHEQSDGGGGAETNMSEHLLRRTNRSCTSFTCFDEPNVGRRSLLFLQLSSTDNLAKCDSRNHSLYHDDTDGNTTELLERDQWDATRRSSSVATRIRY